MTIEQITIMIVFIFAVLFIAMLIKIYFGKQADYGRDSRANGMSYERYKVTNGNGRL